MIGVAEYDPFEFLTEADMSGPNEADVEFQYRRMVVTDLARQRFNNEKAVQSFVLPPSVKTLADELAMPDPPERYTVEGLHPTGGNTLLAAGFKVGKTTLLANLLRSLLDDVPFLGAHGINKPEGRVAFWNYEVGRDQFKRWLHTLGIKNTNAGAVWTIRGYRLPIMTPYVEEVAVQWLKERAVSVLIMDPFSRAYGGDENSNYEVGQFLEALDVIKQKAGVQDLFVAAHTGRGEQEEGAEHVRGATRLDDWADVRWIYKKGTGEFARARYFRADGRDVYLPEQRLDFDPQTLHLNFNGASMREDMAEKYIQDVVAAAKATPGSTKTKLKSQIGGRARNRDGYVNDAVAQGLLRIEEVGQAHNHFLTEAGEKYLQRRVNSA